MESRCQANQGNRVTIRTPVDEYELEFVWESSSVSGRDFALRSFMASGILSLLLISSIAFILSRSLSKRVKSLARQIASAKALDTLAELSSEVAELSPIHEALHTSITQLAAAQDENHRLKTEAAIGALVKQVSHDIRSPLASLQAVMHNAVVIDENARTQVRTAVNRIKEIANGLLAQGRGTTGVAVQGSTDNVPISVTIEAAPRTVELLSALIESSVSQKRIQLVERKDVEIRFDLTADSIVLFAEVQATELHRMISNIINNSVEAFESGGVVTVTLSDHGGWVQIQVADHGKGIPLELLSKTLRLMSKLSRGSQTHPSRSGSRFHSQDPHPSGPGAKSGGLVTSGLALKTLAIVCLGRRFKPEHHRSRQMTYEVRDTKSA